MSDKATLTSRLRVLVARTFRAEKLYSSIRNADYSKLTNPASLADMANDLRGQEWQKAHYRLRSSLNEILKLGNPTAMRQAIAQLHGEFSGAREQSLREVASGIEELKIAAERQEFAHVLRLSTLLIQSKARAQVHKVIIEELESISDVTAASGQMTLESFVPVSTDDQPFTPENPVPEGAGSNVIPLRRRAGSGRRR